MRFSRSIGLTALLALGVGCPKPVETVSFDRSVQPEPLAKPSFTIPSAQSATLSNGVEVLFVENHDLPFVWLNITLKTGGATDPEGLKGLASVTMDMLNEGAGDLDAMAFSDTIRRLGSSINTSGGTNSSTVSSRMLTRNVDATLDLVEAVLFNPRWDEKEWERIRKARKANLKQSAEEPSAIARKVANKVMYGDSYNGRSTTEESLDAITLEAMQSWHSERVVAENALILVAGDTTLEAIVEKLEARFGKWTAGEAAAPVEVATIQPEQTTLYLVDKPGAAQSVIQGRRFVDGDRKSEDYFALALGNAAMGGMFTSRINMNLREDKGYTYGARSFISNGMGPAMWGVSTSVKTATTIDSLKEIKRELEDPNGDRPLTDEEINYVRGSMIQSFPAKFESPNYLVGQRSEMWVYDLPETWLADYIANIEAPTPDEARQALAKHLDPAAISMVVVGDLATFSPGIYCLGWATAHLDREGNPIDAPEDAGCPESTPKEAAE